jgi:23S rRNA pseudouridine1911/1915/1917 synthase
MNPHVLYQDNHLLVVVKPPDIPVMADSSGDADLLTLLKAWRKACEAKPGNVFLGLVHRLDRPVGGVMVFAKTSKAASRLSAQIRDRETGKTYLAVVTGDPTPAAARLCDYLVKEEQTRQVRVVPAGTKDAREAILDYQVIGRQDGMALVEVRLLTGRPHQIRVQLASRGMPIVGDRRYGADPMNGDLPGSGEMALWCEAMEVNHPVSGQRQRFCASPPGTWPWSVFDRTLTLRYNGHSAGDSVQSGGVPE